MSRHMRVDQLGNSRILAPHPNGVEVCRLPCLGSYRQLGVNRGARRRGGRHVMSAKKQSNVFGLTDLLKITAVE
jgi:hypothetical protein